MVGGRGWGRGGREDGKGRGLTVHVFSSLEDVAAVVAGGEVAGFEEAVGGESLGGGLGGVEVSVLDLRKGGFC